MEILELTGQTIKGYEFGDLLGQGGFGVVYRAHQSVVLRDVAVKVVSPKYANQPEFIRRFESEAQVVARLEHPHIVPLYDFWREPDSTCLVMRYLRAGSLRDLIEKQGVLDTALVSKVLEQVGRALKFAHDSGVVHQDIKADNIFLDDDGNAYLSDFGIAKELGADASDGSGTLVGTPAYMAPEQIRGEGAGPQSDIYAFGIMLYEMLSGSRPFAEETLATLVYKHLNEPLPMIDHDALNLPPAFNPIIQRATAKEPSERYEDALSLVMEFQKALRDGAAAVEIELEELDFSEFELLETKNPYKGLRAFQQADAADFFGRTAMINRVLERLQEPVVQSNFLAVIGPSGSGKSSLVKAGVLPALRAGRIPGSENWFYAEMVPGEVPLEELAAALLSVSTSPLPGIVDTLRDHVDGLAQGVYEALPARDSKLLLMIDQFEELFTQVEQENDRQQFLSLILNAVNVEDSPIMIIATLRADFYDRPLLYQGFGELIRARTELVLPLNDEELAETISGPAFRVGAIVEEGLVETIIEDVREQPGALPLLQYALTELFERREGALLTIAAYKDIGGTLGALAKRAEEVYRRFKESGQNMARQMFLRLVTLGEGQEDTRRRILQTELLTLGDREVVEDVIDRFGRYRLLTFDRDDATRSPTVEVAHEALIRRWERLREWLTESRTDIRLERELLHAANEWAMAKKDKSYLMQGNRLLTFEEWAESTNLRLNELELEFLSASLAARDEREREERLRQERERELERQKARNMRIAAAIFGVAAVLAVILSLFAFDQRNQAEEQRSIADEQREIAVEAMTVAETEREIADEQREIAVEAMTVAETERDRADEQRSIADEQREIAVEALHVAEENERKNLSLALAANARAALSENDPGLALPVAFEARFVFEPPEAEVLRILGATTFSPGPRFRFTDSPQSILGVAFNSDGSVGAYAGSEGVVYLVNAKTGESIGAITTGSPVNAIAFSPDGALVAAAMSDMTVGVWRWAAGAQVHRLSGHEAIVTDVEFSADGATLASASADSTVRLWDADNGEPLHILRKHVDYVFKLSFSSDGERLASSSAAIGISESERTAEHNTIQVWDVASGENVLTIPPDGVGFVRDVEFSPDGVTIAATTWSGALGGTARIYDAATGEELQRLYAHRDTIANLEFSPDGALLATASRDQSVKIWDIGKGVLVTSYVDLGDRIQDIEFSPDGETMLIGLGEAGNFPDGSDSPADSSAYLWDLRNRTQAQVYAGHGNWVWAADISADGSLVATGSGPLFGPESVAALDATARIWDAETGEVILVLEGHTDTVDSVRFLPDGQQLLSAGWDGTIRRWDLSTGAEIQRYLVEDASVFMIDLLPNGAQFVSGSSDGLIRLWDIESGDVIREYSGHGDPVNGVQVSADGKLLVSASGGWGRNDLTVRLWDIESGELLQTFEGHVHIVNYARLAPNNEFIISTSWDKTVRMWDVATGEEIRQFVGHAGNTFGIAITEDSATLLTTSSDTTVRMWDVASGEELNRFEQHGDWIQEIVLGPGEDFGVSAGQDYTARRWVIKRTADDLIDWARGNRYIRALSCAERQSYRLECQP
ncbi:MAG: protein kinase [Chloroflexota bacterium]|nr:protein kinase [Chloroflexota bacterium]MDE2908375.1 protein kinase [Chloroflexota bacterium]